jgi:argininosuccinate lyase
MRSRARIASEDPVTQDHEPATQDPGPSTPDPGPGTQHSAKLWGGRFAKETDAAVDSYNASLGFDRRLYRQDIAGSIAHARMLARQGIIPEADAEQIVRGLETILGEIERGAFVWDQSQEDIHMAVEARLTALVGPEPAGKLHTARSRNDQVALDVRMFARDAIDATVGLLRGLRAALIEMAERHLDVVLPGYTHLQRAQPILLGHHFLAYQEMFERDTARFVDCRRRTNVMPLGAGALAGLPYPLDRGWVAEQLGFAEISRNSLDAVSDRDFLVEYHAAAALTMAHISRLAEEIVLWSTAEFGFITLDDAFATGSSIMPQKKNADVAELGRGKTGRVYGNLIGLLTVLKALPLSYNKDLQEDKEGFFDTVDTLGATLDLFTRMLPTIRVNAERMSEAAIAGYALATDVADYLARKGVPFRTAHHIVGGLVQDAIGQGRELHELPLEAYKRHSPLFADDVLRINLASSVTARDVPGGTAPNRVREALAQAKQRLAAEQTA